MSEETKEIKCPDGQTRKFLIQKEGVFGSKYAIYEIRGFGNTKIAESPNRKSVADIIRLHFPNNWKQNVLGLSTLAQIFSLNIRPI